MEMRRKDLAVTEKEQIDAIIQSCDCVRLAFADGTHPYIVPLSFGYHREDGVSKLYFHSEAAVSYTHLMTGCFFSWTRKMSIRGKRKRFRQSAASPCAFGAAIGRRRDTTGV